MGNFNKKYIIKEAESILQECNRKICLTNSDKNKMMILKIKNKKQKRKIVFWQICSAILGACVILQFI